jgi:magnesium chelatase family protein
MLARRLPTILPVMSREEALEVTQLHSVAGLLQGELVRERPFRSPHHTVSPAALLGGGSAYLRPGEVSLASHGVLFLDEFTEFRRDAVEGLRQPLEDGRVVVTRMAGTAEFPARFTLVAAANPCPCGYRGDASRRCTCRDDRIGVYTAKLSGPLLDRVDIRLTVPRLTKQELLGQERGEPSAAVRERVEEARSDPGLWKGPSGPRFFPNNGLASARDAYLREPPQYRYGVAQGGHTMDWVLRRGESFTRWWKPQGDRWSHHPSNQAGGLRARFWC